MLPLAGRPLHRPRRRTGREAACAAWLLLFGLSACGGEAEPAASAAGATRLPAQRPRNLIVLSIDTLRADHLGCYGYERETSPAIDAFAARGTLFEEAFTTASWTVPAHASLFTGLYPRSHGVENLKQRLPADAPTLAELLGGAGLETAAIVNVYFLGRHSTLSRGFEHTGQYPPKGDETGAAPRLLAAAEDWLEATEEPFFLFLHCYDVHASYQAQAEFTDRFCGPYEGPVDGTGGQLFFYNEGRLEQEWGPRDAARLVDLYDAGLRQFDTRLAGFFQYLDRSGLSESTLVVVTSDHGEAFLEHGVVMHGRTLYEEELAVPLIFVGPGVPAGQRIAGAVSLVDLVPTVLGQFSVELPAHVEGVDLAPTWRTGAPAPERELYFETVGGPRDDAPQRALRAGDFKLYRDARTETLRLFDLARDPGEVHDVAADHPAVFARLANELGAFEAARRTLEPAGQLSAQEIEALQMLGYL